MTNSYSGDATLVWDGGQAEVFVNLMTHGDGHGLKEWSGHVEPTDDARTFDAFTAGRLDVRLPDGRTGKALARAYLEDGTLTLTGDGRPPYA